MVKSKTGQSKEDLSKSTAIRFIILLGIVSLFADATYEGARSITGPYLGILGASATVVGFVAGFGEFVGYALRLVSGYLGDKTKSYWTITIFGYALNLVAVPLLAFAGSWKIAALLIILERAGKAIRSPVRDAMLSYATHQTGRGWGFGLHEAMDQTGALLGPLAVAWAMSQKVSYPSIFSYLAIPAILSLASVFCACLLFPRPHELEKKGAKIETHGYPKEFWIYLAGASLIAIGYADFPLIAFHFQKTSGFSETWIPIFYALAMALEGAAALIFGRLFDRIGFKALLCVLIGSSFFAPFVFQTGLNSVFLGMIFWGVGMGAHDSVMRATIADWVPPQKRSSAYGLFNGVYGIAWFVGSACMGLLYDKSITGLVWFSVLCQLAAVPFLFKTYSLVQKRRRNL